MSLDLALGIARSGLAAVQRGLAQASQNLANAQTPGYVRKTLEQRSLVVAEMPAGLRSSSATLSPRWTAGRASIVSSQRPTFGNCLMSWPWRSQPRAQPTQAMSAIE